MIKCPNCPGPFVMGIIGIKGKGPIAEGVQRKKRRQEAKVKGEERGRKHFGEWGGGVS